MVPSRIVGAFVFPDVWSDRIAFRQLITGLHSAGVNAIVTESDAYDAAAIDAVHELGMRFFAGVACFSDHASKFATLAARPALWPILENGQRRPQMEWYVGITPTDRAHQLSILAKIDAIASRYPIDGLFLDFVRWPLHWELELRPGKTSPLDSSFDDATLEAFARSTHIDLSAAGGSSRERAAWTLRHRRREWIDFKCRVITDFVAEARRTLQSARGGAALGAFLVPDGSAPSEPLTGQRWADLAPLIDWAAPMLYHNILLQPADWIGRMVDKSVAAAGRKTLPVIQAASNDDPETLGDWGPPMGEAEWRSALAEAANRSDISGFIVFPGPSLAAPDRGRVLNRMLTPG